MYQVELESKVKKFLDKLDKSTATQITKKLLQLENNPHLGKPLLGNLSNHWRLRIGKYRAIYQIHEGKLIIIVLDIGHRKNIY